MYAKLLVQGPDALKALNWISGANIDIAVGQTVYTQFLNAKGGIEADVTILRQAAERFLIITGHPSQITDQHFIRQNTDPAWRFELVDLTSAYSLMTLHGPQSRAIVQALSGDDFSNDAFAFGAAKVMDLAHVRAEVIRRSYLGELGFELLLPTEFTAHVYEAIREVGDPLGLRHAGMFTLGACRLEKGFRHFGHDIGDEDTPFETGLGFAVDLSKPDFLGKAALVKQRETFGTATQYRTVSLRLREATAEAGPYLIHNEPIWRDGEIVGYVTSGGWGWRVEAMIGLASLYRTEGVSADWLKGEFQVQIAGVLHPIDVQLAGFYDPKGEIMRG